MSNQEVLTITDVFALHTIISSASQCAKVAWVDDASGNVLYGTSRHIVHSPDNFGFPGSDEDVRDCYLRITTANGFEAALSVRELMPKATEGTFAIYDW